MSPALGNMLVKHHAGWGMNTVVVVWHDRGVHDRYVHFRHSAIRRPNPLSEWRWQFQESKLLKIVFTTPPILKDLWWV